MKLRHGRTFHAIALCCLLIASADLRGEIHLAGVFGDHMVLQQGMPLKIWGSATPGQSINVKVADRSATTKTGDDGKWSVKLDPLQASSTAVSFSVSGDNTIELQDVLVGDVWLASGQSNMQYSVKNAHNGAEALADANVPELRLCTVGNKPSLTPTTDRSVKWQLCTPATAKGFSAVAYFFGRDIQKSRNCPVGVIGAYVSGTPAQSWTPLEALQSSPVLQHYVDGLHDASASGKPINAGVPSSLFNGLIAPLTPIAIKGVIWYQGESNTDNPEEYRTLFPAMIAGWRKAFGRDDLPFLFVQLPGFRERQSDPSPSKWSMLREAQALALKLPKTGMAVTLDLVPAKTILHPKNKVDVGRRLALAARAIAYGESIEASGPMFDSVKIDGDTIRVHFSHATGGLVLKSPPEEKLPPPTTAPSTLAGFAVAGEDRKFVWADATIDGDSVILKTNEVKSPAAVRFAWGDNPGMTLYNQAGLPAAPFRTDDWPQ